MGTGMFMDLRIGQHARITSATLNLFDTLAIILLVPLYDLVLVPLLARRGIRITYLQRIGWGLLVPGPPSPLPPRPSFYPTSHPSVRFQLDSHYTFRGQPGTARKLANLPGAT